ncbi:hypothetical protein BDW62DRAFT_121413 [Aspergillus aurantiobrunneus]
MLGMIHSLSMNFAKILILVYGVRSLSLQSSTASSQYLLDKDLSDIHLSEKWQALGPFQCGTREAIWGADPLEYWGGFRNLSFDETKGFTSPLAPDGIVRWTLVWANVTNPYPTQSRAEIMVAFPQVDWKFLQSVYGWPALQYQAWVRGYLHLQNLDCQAVAIFTDGVLDLFIDGRRYFGGDFDSYRRAPLILSLAPGEHVVELRLIRDVRALGAEGDPTISVVFETEIRHGMLTIDERTILIPEATDWDLGSIWASVNVQNNAAEWVEVISLDSTKVGVVMEVPLRLAPYQTRPLVFQFTAGNLLSVELSVNIRYKILREETTWLQSFRVIFTSKSLSQTQRFTYMHPSGIVSYGILRPPPLDSCLSNQSETSLPIIIGLHGAGLEADSMQVRGMLNAAYGICAWMMFPSGVTSWSGDDWHTWGVADLKAAVGAMSDWVRAVGWAGPGISAKDWMVIGHSNGGQGAWFLVTHYPDNVIAAAPVSGYASIENYVPYNMWRDSEPLISSVLHQSRISFKHELLLANAAGIPMLQQHGSNDTNVPAHHSRLMHGLLGETGWSSDYVELPNEGHWFADVMTTTPLLKFYEDSLRSIGNRTPSVYTIHVPPSGDMESKGGICVDQLQSPDRLGRLHVKIDSQQRVWHIRTKNIHRFHLSDEICETEGFIVLVLDKTDIQFKVDPFQCGSTWYIKDDADGSWVISKQLDWQTISQRYGRQMGSMDAILRTHGIFTINICSAGAEETAIQISRNLLQYFAADTYITSQCSSLNATFPGNVITISLGNELPKSALSSYPIHVTDGHINLYRECFLVPGDLHGVLKLDTSRNCHKYTVNCEPDIGALFLRPLGGEGLELVVWGADMDGLEQAARLVPTLTGAGQPEFLILGDSCRWEGHAGLYAAGHFDKSWQISRESYIANGI